MTISFETPIYGQVTPHHLVQCRYDSVYSSQCLLYHSKWFIIVCMYICFMAAVILRDRKTAAQTQIAGKCAGVSRDSEGRLSSRRVATKSDKESSVRKRELLEQLDDLHCGSFDPISFLICKLLIEIWETCKYHMYLYSVRHPKPAPNGHIHMAPVVHEVQRGDNPPKRHSKAHVVPKSFVNDGRSSTRESGYVTESRTDYIQTEGYKVPVINGYANTVAKHTDISGVACSTVGSSDYVTGSRDYSQKTYKSKIVGAGSVTLTKPTDFFAIESEPDKKIGAPRQQTVEGNVSSMAGTSGYVSSSTLSIRTNTKLLDSFGDDKLMYDASKAYHKDQYDLNGYRKMDDQPRKDKTPKTDHEDNVQSVMTPGYNKPTYAVLIGNSVKVYSTSVFALLPSHSTFMVKERQKDSSGVTRVKLALKSSTDQRYHAHNAWQTIITKFMW